MSLDHQIDEAQRHQRVSVAVAAVSREPAGSLHTKVELPLCCTEMQHGVRRTDQSIRKAWARPRLQTRNATAVAQLGLCLCSHETFAQEGLVEDAGYGGPLPFKPNE